MNDTDKLIDQLASWAGPVKRLASPLSRTVLWLALAVTTIVIIVASHGVRPGLIQAISDPRAATEWAASVLTGVFAAYAAFQISVPGRSSSWTWLPLPAALVWVASMSLGCLREVKEVGIGAFAFQIGGMECARAIALTSLPLGLVLLFMVRHAGVVRPGPTAMLAALSAAALSAAGVSIIHENETALMVLLWHAGAVSALSFLSWSLGNYVFSWIGYGKGWR